MLHAILLLLALSVAVFGGGGGRSNARDVWTSRNGVRVVDSFRLGETAI